MSNVGATIYAFEIVIGMQCITSYIVDAYSLYAASVIAVTTVLRSLRGFDLSHLSSLFHIRERRLIIS